MSVCKSEGVCVSGRRGGKSRCEKSEKGETTFYLVIFLPPFSIFWSIHASLCAKPMQKTAKNEKENKPPPARVPGWIQPCIVVGFPIGSYIIY